MEMDFAGHVRTVADARAFATSEIGRMFGAEAEAVLYDATLVVSELVTNAVRAGSRRIRLALEMAGDHLEIRVSDDAPGWPVLQDATTFQTSGRGLILVSAIAHQWGVVREVDGGKQVWATLAAPVLGEVD